MVSKLSEIWCGLFIPDTDPEFFNHPGSRIQGSERHRIPDPQHWKLFSWTKNAFVVTFSADKNGVPGGGAGAGWPGGPEHGGHPGPGGRGAAGRQPSGAEPPLPALPRLPGRGGGHHCSGPLRTQAACHTCPLLTGGQQFQDTALGSLLSKSFLRNVLVPVLRIRIRIRRIHLLFWPPRSGSSYHQAKIVRKTLIPTVLRLRYDFLSLKDVVYVFSKINVQKNLEIIFVGENSRIRIHMSEVWRYGSADPDPYQNFMDPQHWLYRMSTPSSVCLKNSVYLYCHI